MRDGWKLDEVEIETSEQIPGVGGWRRHTIPAYTRGAMAVHLGWHERDGHEWALTHIPSASSLAWFPHLECALDCAEALLDERPWDMERPAVVFAGSLGDIITKHGGEIE